MLHRLFSLLNLVNIFTLSMYTTFILFFDMIFLLSINFKLIYVSKL